MRKIDQIKEVIKDFMERGNVDYAFLIDGEWGCGKTHFFKHYIIKNYGNNYSSLTVYSYAIKEVLKTKYDYKFVYVSLYGIKSIEEIDKAIYLELNPNFKNRFLKLIGKVGKTWLKLTSLFNKNDIKDYINLENAVLCFDDFERSNINDIFLLMGYINQFVEHQGVKTIIIGNEKELIHKYNIEEVNKDDNNEDRKKEKNENNTEKEKNKNLYERTKEKLIGYTLKYEPDFDNVIDTLIGNYKENDEAYFNFLYSNKELILDIISTSKNNNIRILNRSIDNFYLLFRFVVDEYEDKFNEKSKANEITTIKKDLLHFALALGYVVLSGEIPKSYLDALEKFIAHKKYHLRMSWLAEDPNFKFVNDNFVIQYFKGRIRDRFTPYSIFKYVSEGFFDKNEFKMQIEKYLDDKESNEKVKENYFVGSFWKLEYDEFKNISTLYLENIRKGELEYPSAYLLLYSNYLLYSKDNYNLINENIEELKQIFEKGIELAKQNRKLIYEKDLKAKTLIKDPNEIYISYQHKVYSINKELMNIENSNNVLLLFEKLSNDPTEFIDKVCYTDYSTKPVFKFLPMDELFKKILHLKNDDIVNLLNGLDHRYDFEIIEIYEDCQSLNELSYRIEIYTRYYVDRIKKFILNHLINKIKEICNKSQ